jgi:hypothetical protein
MVQIGILSVYTGSEECVQIRERPALLQAHLIIQRLHCFGKESLSLCAPYHRLWETSLSIACHSSSRGYGLTLSLLFCPYTTSNLVLRNTSSTPPFYATPPKILASYHLLHINISFRCQLHYPLKPSRWRRSLVFVLFYCIWRILVLSILVWFGWEGGIKYHIRIEYL